MLLKHKRRECVPSAPTTEHSFRCLRRPSAYPRNGAQEAPRCCKSHQHFILNPPARANSGRACCLIIRSALTSRRGQLLYSVAVSDWNTDYTSTWALRTFPFGRPKGCSISATVEGNENIGPASRRPGPGTTSKRPARFKEKRPFVVKISLYSLEWVSQHSSDGSAKGAPGSAHN